MISTIRRGIEYLVGMSILLLLVSLWIQIFELMPENAQLYVTKNKTYVSPPCIEYFGPVKFGFNDEMDLKASLTTNGAVPIEYEANLICRDKYPDTVGNILGIRIPIWLRKAIRILTFGYMNREHKGGFTGDNRSWLLFKIFGFNHARWNDDGTWNW